MDTTAAAVDRYHRLLDAHGETLLQVAAASIRHGLTANASLPVTAAEYPEPLRQDGASFVTLTHRGALRGCVGSSLAHRPLVSDVAANAFAAAFHDSRFPTLVLEDLDGLALSVTLLSDAVPIHFVDEADLLAMLRPGTDGLIIASDGKRALFLPQVWAAIPDPRDFLQHLKQKAGIRSEQRREEFSAERFEAVSIASTEIPDSARLWR
jgi:Uncharacterized conserved protein